MAAPRPAVDFEPRRIRVTSNPGSCHLAACGAAAIPLLACLLVHPPEACFTMAVSTPGYLEPLAFAQQCYARGE